MIGLGETDEEIIQTIADLRSAGVSILTIGQYLQPTSRHLPVAEYITPGKFNWMREIASEMGFLHVAAGPFVRSSYKAGDIKFPTHLRPDVCAPIACSSYCSYFYLFGICVYICYRLCQH